MTERLRIVLTRERERCAEWRRRLGAVDADWLDLPLLRFETLTPDPALAAAPRDWILFTSPQGVRAWNDAGLDRHGAQVGALGAGTAAALAEVGLPDDLEVRTEDGAALAQAFTQRVKGACTVLLPGPERRLEDPRRTLEAAGHRVLELPLYRTNPVPAADLPAAPFAPGDVVFFASPSAVRVFADVWNDRPECVTIGETTARAARQAGFVPRVAASPDPEAMARACGLDPSPERES